MRAPYNTFENKQQGATLIVALIMLLIMSIIAITSMSTSVLEEKMSVNLQNYVNVFQVAESGIDQTIEDIQLLTTLTPASPSKTTTPSLGTGAKALVSVEITYVSGLDDDDKGGLTGDASNNGASASKGGGGAEGSGNNEIATVYYTGESTAHLTNNTNIKTDIKQGFYYCATCQE